MTAKLEKIRIVLVRTTHPGNIGATARAMANMGLSDLALVSPKQFPDYEAYARASGADQVLDNAVVCASLDQALDGFNHVFATSARVRSVGWPTLDVEQTARQIRSGLALGERAAVVFGPEHSGLSNDEVDRSQYLLRIPVDDRFASINLGASVMLVCYELRKALEAGPVPPPDRESPASAGRMQGFFQHLESALEHTGFLGEMPHNKLMRKLVRLFNRARPTDEELNILRGILTSIEKPDK